MKKDYQLIDIAKFIFSICIIGIHTQLFAEYKIGYYIKTNIFRLAVPFFFICNGYFIAKNIEHKRYNKKNIIILIKQYLFWCIFYTVLYNFLAAWEFDFENLVLDIINVFTFRTTNIMWYLGVFLIFSCSIYYIKDNKKLKIIYIMSIFGYILGLSFVTYKYLFIGNKYELIIDFLEKYFKSNRYFPFTIVFPFIGYYLYKSTKVDKIPMYKQLSILVLSQLLLFIETYIYYDKSITFNEYDYFLFTPLVSVSLFIVLLKYDKKINLHVNTNVLRKLSKSLFFNHYIFIYLFHLYDKVTYSETGGTDKIVIWFRQNNLRMFLYVITCTMILSLIINKKRNKIVESDVNEK